MRSKYWDRVDRDCPLSEYPRPQLVRDSYICLNGEWECEFTGAGDGRPDSFSKRILVPFSPETELSGVNRALAPDEALWYRRFFNLRKKSDTRCILHIDAADRTAEVALNGIRVGSHVGGYTPFSLDITEALSDGDNELVVKVTDEGDAGQHSRGKQRKKRGGIWYTQQSGIWQTVWLEEVPSVYIKSVKTVPLFDEGALEVTVETNAGCAVEASALGVSASGRSGDKLRLVFGEGGWEPWSPESPTLYDLEISAGDDRVKSYFGMRKFEVKRDGEGIKRLFLNGRPYFHTGVLDQGYYSDGMLTPPCDEAMVDDISLMKSMGFNALRKHIKIEPLRWYYHCDRLGMLVWQDMINGGGRYNPLVVSLPVFFENMSIKDSHYRLFARDSEEGREQYYRELRELLGHLISCVSIAMWVPFNEGWGQFDSKAALELINSLDGTRTVDHASGWHDQHIGETRSLHVYFRPYRFTPDKLGRAVMLTEFGGFSLREEGHCFSAKTFGYKGCKSEEELLSALRELYERDIIPAKKQGLAACIYTQLSDVEDEVNGFVTYDRKKIKLCPEKVAEINRRLRD